MVMNQMIIRTTMVIFLLCVNTMTVAQDTSPEEQHRACMSSAWKDPANGLKLAEIWTANGGGEAAEYCAATSLFGLGRFAQAAERFAGLAERAPQNARRAILLSQASRAWYQANDLNQATVLIDQAIELRPGDAQQLVDRAEIKAARGQYKDAIVDLTAAIELNPGLADAYAFRASAYRRMGQPEAALADLDHALRIVPMHAESLLERGLIRQQSGDIKGARSDWNTILVNASNPDAINAAEYYLAHFPGEQDLTR